MSCPSHIHWDPDKYRLAPSTNIGKVADKSEISLSCIDKVITGVARGVMVIVVGNGHGDTSSNPGRDWFHFN